MKDHRTGRCAECGQDALIAARGLCYKCYRAQQRLEHNPFRSADASNPAQQKRNKKCRAAINKLLDAVDLAILSPEDNEALKGLAAKYGSLLMSGLQPHLEPDSPAAKLRADVVAACLGLRFKPNEIEAACDKVDWSKGTLDDKLKEVLALLRPPPDFEDSESESSESLNREKGVNSVNGESVHIVHGDEEEAQSPHHESRSVNVNTENNVHVHGGSEADAGDESVNRDGNVHETDANVLTRLKLFQTTLANLEVYKTALHDRGDIVRVGDSAVLYLEDFILDEPRVFEQLKALPQWSPEALKMYGKDIITERETINFGQHYDYNPAAKPAYAWGESDAVTNLRNLLQRVLRIPMTQCALNYYPDKSAYIGLHHDKKGPEIIISLSFGSHRDMGFGFHKDTGERPNKTLPTITLSPGSLLLFTGAFNSVYKHCITKSKRECGERISATFRAFPAGEFESGWTPP